MSPTTSWLLMGGWLLLSIVVGLFLGAFIKAGKGPQ